MPTNPPPNQPLSWTPPYSIPSPPLACQPAPLPAFSDLFREPSYARIEKVICMLTDYIKAAMKRAKFERLQDGTIYGHLPGFQGVWANAKTQATCRRELQEVLEEWILFRLKHELSLPVVEDLDLNKVVA